MRIIESCTKNEDTFSWKELNCLHKPFATAFKSFDKNLFDAYLVLVSFLCVFIVKNDQNEEYSFPKVYEKYLEDFFGIKLKKEYFCNKFEMLKKIKESIDLNFPIVIPVNIIELKYNPMYKLEDHYKNMIIKGYDFEREIIFILDNSHDDFGSSTILTDFVSGFEEMYNMAMSYSSFFEEYDSKKSYFYSICLKGESKKTIRNLDILKKLQSFLYRISPKENENNKMFFRSPELKLLSFLGKEKEEYSDIDLDRVLAQINFRTVFTKTLVDIVNVYDNEVADIISNEFAEIEKRWNDIKFKLIIKISRRQAEYDELKPTIREVVALEKNYYIKLYSLIDKIQKDEKCLEVKGQINGFCLKNNNNAKLTHHNNSVIISLNNQKTFDIWSGIDDGVQLIKTLNSSSISIYACMDIEGELGDPYQCGIIVKLSDGEKILFGSTNGNHISVFRPSLKDKFEVYHELSEYALNDVTIKVNINDNKLTFIHICENKEFEVASLILDVNVSEVGFFVKSWIKTNCSVNFKRMECIENNN